MVWSKNHIPEWAAKYKYVYYEVVTEGMLVGVYYGVADEFDP